MLRRLTTIALVSIGLASCASTESGDAKKPVELASALAQPPAELERACAGPIRLAKKFLEHGMSAGEVERTWSRDRSRLIMCADKFAEYVKWRRDLATRFSGKPLPPPPAAPSDAPVAAPSESPAFRNAFAGLFGEPDPPAREE